MSKKELEDKMKKAKKEAIKKDMTLAEAVARYPKTIPVFMKYGMHCIGCPMAMQETLGEGLIGHGIPVDKIIDELNKAIKKKK